MRQHRIQEPPHQSALRLIATLGVAILCLLSLPALAEELSAQVDRQQMSINETLTLTVSYQGQTMDEPDFSVLENNFDILSRQQQSQLSFGFGQNTSTTDWILALAPRRTGSLTIPAFHFKGASSAPITVAVAEAAPANDSRQPIFLETELDRQSAYIQSQVILTIRLHTRVRLSSVDISELALADARVLKIHDSQFKKTINGQEYVVVELKYALFPEAAGTLDIPPVTVTAVVPDRTDPFGGTSLFAGRGKPVRLNSEPVTLEVLPIPDASSASNWLPSKGISLSQRWSRPPENLTVGEPITRSVTVTAQGLTGAQLPPLRFPEGSGFKTYPDQPDISESVSATGVLGSRSDSVAIVATQPGTLTLPEQTITWWDTEANVERTTRLEARTLNILPATEPAGPATGSATEPGADESEGPDHEGVVTLPPWTYISLIANGVLLLLVVVLTALWFRSERREPPARARPPAPDTEASAFAALVDTETNDPETFRRRAVQWARHFWPNHTIHTLTDIAKLAEDENLNNLFTNMEQTLYGTTSGQTTDLTALRTALTNVRSRLRQTNLSQSSLKSLYPDAS